MKNLYKMDSTGKIREWSIRVGKDGGIPFYEVAHGVKEGKLQTSKVYVPEGKNIGRMNETTPEEQCELEAQALWLKQRDRKGYTEKIPKEKPLRPMLAQPFKKHGHKIEYPCFVSPKLDGIRCLAIIKDGNVKLMSRQGKEFPFLDHIRKELSRLKDVILDGEFYLHGMNFQDIASIVRKSKTRHEDESKLQYHIFDVVSDEDFSARYRQYIRICEQLNSPHIDGVLQIEAMSANSINASHMGFVQLGYEGSMIRNKKGPYQLNRRSSDLQKNKDWIDQEFKVVGYKTGKGKFENVPTFQLVAPNGGVFEATPKGTEERRAQYLKDADSIIGKFATVRYFENSTSDVPVPRFPVLIDIRDYE
jgi:DNA ligase-1